MVLCLECLGKELLTVSGCPCRNDFQSGTRLFVALPHLNQGTLCHHKRFSFIRCIERAENFLIFSDQNKLCRRTARIDSQIGSHRLSRFRLFPFHRFCRMSAAKYLFLFFRRKKWPGFLRVGILFFFCILKKLCVLGSGTAFRFKHRLQ